MYELELSKAERRKLRKLFKEVCRKLKGYPDIRRKRYSCLVPRGNDHAEIILETRYGKLDLNVEIIRREGIEEISSLRETVANKSKELRVLEPVDFLGRIYIDADEVGEELGLKEAEYKLDLHKFVLSASGSYDSVEKVKEVLQRLSDRDLLFKYVYDKSKLKEALIRHLKDLRGRLDRDREILTEIIREIS